MNHLHTIHITSLDDLRNNAAVWDDLWWRSDAALPTARAETLAQWIEQFRPRADFHALVVAQAGRWIAALPLVSCRLGGLISAGSLPGNDWSPCGEMLCDVANDPAPAMDLLLSAIAGLPWNLLWLNETVPEAPRWQSLLRACQRAELPAAYHEHYRVGRVAIDGDWDRYLKRLPKNHRQAMNRSARRLEGEGNVQFEMNSRLEPDQVEPWLAEAFEVEDLSWKGTAGSSVLRARACSASSSARPSSWPAGDNWRRPRCGWTAGCWPSPTVSAPRASTSPTRSATIRGSPPSVRASSFFIASWNNSTPTAKLTRWTSSGR